MLYVEEKCLLTLCSHTVRVHSSLPVARKILLIKEKATFFLTAKPQTSTVSLWKSFTLSASHKNFASFSAHSQFYCHFFFFFFFFKKYNPIGWTLLLSSFLLLSSEVKVDSYFLFLAWAALLLNFWFFHSDAYFFFFAHAQWFFSFFMFTGIPQGMNIRQLE